MKRSKRIALITATAMGIAGAFSGCDDKSENLYQENENHTGINQVDADYSTEDYSQDENETASPSDTFEPEKNFPPTLYGSPPSSRDEDKKIPNFYGSFLNRKKQDKEISYNVHP